MTYNRCVDSRRAPRSTLFPYTTLFRSGGRQHIETGGERFRDLARRDQARVSKAFRSEEHTSELQSRPHLVCRLLLEKKKTDAMISKSEMSNKSSAYSRTGQSCCAVSHE